MRYACKSEKFRKKIWVGAAPVQCGYGTRTRTVRVFWITNLYAAVCWLLIVGMFYFIIAILPLMEIIEIQITTQSLTIWCSLNSVSFKSHSISVTLKLCTVRIALCALEPHSTDSLGTQHRAKESNTNRMTSGIQAHSFTKWVHCMI